MSFAENLVNREKLLKLRCEPPKVSLIHRKKPKNGQ